MNPTLEAMRAALELAATIALAIDSGRERGNEIARAILNTTDDELEAAMPKQEPVAWRCFHCGNEFTDEASAKEHFGASWTISNPACHVGIAAYRRMEENHIRNLEEDSELHREIHRLRAAHFTELRREEEKGYARGLKEAMPKQEPEKSHDIRAEFEFHHCNRETARRNEHGDYVLPSIQDAWSGWKHAAELYAAPAAPNKEVDWKDYAIKMREIVCRHMPNLTNEEINWMDNMADRLGGKGK